MPRYVDIDPHGRVRVFHSFAIDIAAGISRKADNGAVALGGRLRVGQTLMSDLVDSEDIVGAGWVPVSR